MHTNILWMLFVLAVNTGLSEGEIECKTTSKCLCFGSINEYEYQCPPYLETNRVVIHVEPEDSVLIDCYELDKFDLNILPDISVGSVQRFVMRKCPLPDKSFTQILNKFQINTNDLFLKFEFTDLSNVNFSKQYFDGLEDLRLLALDSNDLVKLDDDVFANTPNLQYIDLKDNKIELTSKHFQYTPLLKSLDLVGNNLRTLPDGLFENLSEIQILHLWKNKLSRIEKNTLKGLSNLTSLELSYNKIEFIDEEAFVNAKQLVNISLLSNLLKLIPERLFQQNTLIELVRLGLNPNLQLPDYLLSNLPKLKTVHLSNCNLEIIPEHIFENSTNIETIFLANNKLTYLSTNLFSGLEYLRELRLEGNQINKLENSLLKPLKSLEIFNFENNLLTEIGEELFADLNNLKEINFNANIISSIHRSAFIEKDKITKINLAHNRITHTQSDIHHVFNPCHKLEDLDLSNNLITYFDDDLTTTKVNLKSLDLSYNQINSISINSLMKISHFEVKINLSNNNITKVDFESTELIARENAKLDSYSYTGSSSVIFLANNPIECDCNVIDLVRYFRDDLDPNVRTLFNIKSSDLKCAGPPLLKDYPVDKLPPTQLTCPLGEVVRNYTSCSDKCDCMWKPYEKAIVVNCSSRNLMQIPQIILPEFWKYNQTEVYLENNNISKGPSEALRGFDNVTKLYLSNNYIDNIKWLPPKLEILKLDNNKMEHIDYKVLDILNTTRLLNMSIQNNPWVCDCEAANLTNFLKYHLRQVDYSTVRCNNQKLLINMSHNDLCQSRTKLYLVIGIVVTLSLCIFATLYALYWRFNQEIKVWCYAHNMFLRWVTEEELDKDKIYDAFISYSHKDENFVIENLLPVLEGGPQPYKLCIHVRNWIAGEYISKQIADSVRDSRRTLVVLSSNFIDSVWGKMEFRTAHTQAMSEGRARVIIVLLGDIDIESLDEELKTYLKTNTYVKWGDPWFWDKVKYALPHANKRLQNNKQKHANIMSSIDDKFSLVVKNGTTNPGSTPPVLTLDANLLKKDPLEFTISSNRDTPPAESGNNLLYVNNP